MHTAKRIIVAAAAAMAATGLLAGAANASTSLRPSDPSLATAVTFVDNNGTVPGYSGYWASDWLVRTASVSGGAAVAPSYCGQTTGPCYSYTADVHDHGWFRAIRGALTPNQVVPGRTIESAVTGWVSGYAPFSFYATATPDANLVPKTYDNGPYLTLWPELFFPYGTTFVGVTGIPFTFNFSAWTRCGFQHWTDASFNDFGDLAQDGNIVGCRYHH